MMHLRHEATRLVQEIQAVEKSNGGRRDGSYFDETAVRERNAATATKSLALEVISGAFYNLSAVKELERSQMEDDQREFAAAKRWLGRHDVCVNVNMLCSVQIGCIWL